MSSDPELWSKSDEEEVADDDTIHTASSPAFSTVQVFVLFILLWQSMF